MSAQQYIIDAATRHQVFLQRYAGGESKKALAMLSRLRHEITVRLMAEPTQFQVQRLSLVLADIDQLYAGLSGALRESVKQSTNALVVQEAAHSAKLYGTVTNVDWVLPADAMLIAAVDNSMMSVGRTGVNINTAIRMMSAKHASTVRQTIMDGVTLGDTTADIARSVSSIVNTVQRRDVNTVVRTAINHASSMARSSMYEANSDILQGYEWVSTLDSKTSLICGGRDGIIYTNPTDPRPPAHFSCRSTTIPKVKDEYKLAGFEGERPAIGAGGVESVSANKSYGTWLKTQPKEFVDEALGVERSKLFRSGKISMDKFTDPTGRTLSLVELEAMSL